MQRQSLHMAAILDFTRGCSEVSAPVTEVWRRVIGQQLDKCLLIGYRPQLHIDQYQDRVGGGGGRAGERQVRGGAQPRDSHHLLEGKLDQAGQGQKINWN